MIKTIFQIALNSDEVIKKKGTLSFENFVSASEKIWQLRMLE